MKTYKRNRPTGWKLKIMKVKTLAPYRQRFRQSTNYSCAIDYGSLLNMLVWSEKRLWQEQFTFIHLNIIDFSYQDVQDIPWDYFIEVLVRLNSSLTRHVPTASLVSLRTTISASPTFWFKVLTGSLQEFMPIKVEHGSKMVGLPVHLL